jgi:hypothetical protein
LKQYFYYGSYAYPPAPKDKRESDRLSGELMLLHLAVYKIAEKALVEPLKELAETNFAQAIADHASHDRFPQAAQMAYRITARDARGERLRAIVVNAAIKYAGKLLPAGAAQTRFKVVMEQTPELGSDISMALLQERRIS